MMGHLPSDRHLDIGHVGDEQKYLVITEHSVQMFGVLGSIFLVP